MQAHRLSWVNTAARSWSGRRSAERNRTGNPGRAERRSTEAVELLKLIGDFDQAKAFGLPTSLGMVDKGWGRGTEAYWSRRQVMAWREQLKTFASSVK